MPRGEHPIAVVGVQRGHPAVAYGSVGIEPGDLARDVVRIDATAVVVRFEDTDRKQRGERRQACFDVLAGRERERS